MVTVVGLYWICGPTVTFPSGKVTPVAVNVTGEPVSAFTFAVSVFDPALGPSVRVTEAMPSLPVIGDSDDTLPPPSPTTHVTVTKPLGLLWPSFTRTLCAVGRRLVVQPVWAFPPFSAICVALPEVAVAEIARGDPTSPVTVATAACGPAVPPSVSVTAETPLPSVVSVAWLGVPPPVPDQLTITLGTTAPVWSRATTENGVPSVESTVSLWLPPPFSSREVAPWICEKVENVIGEPLSPARVAVAVCVPAFGPRVRVALATPLASVLPAELMDPPPTATAQVTATFATGLPSWSRTITRNGVGRGVPALATWLSPVAVAVLAGR